MNFSSPIEERNRFRQNPERRRRWLPPRPSFIELIRWTTPGYIFTGVIGGFFRWRVQRLSFACSPPLLHPASHRRRGLGAWGTSRASVGAVFGPILVMSGQTSSSLRTYPCRSGCGALLICSSCTGRVSLRQCASMKAFLAGTFPPARHTTFSPLPGLLKMLSMLFGLGGCGLCPGRP